MSIDTNGRIIDRAAQKADITEQKQESVLTWLARLLRPVLQRVLVKGYHGKVQLTVTIKDGHLTHIDKTEGQTIEARMIE